MKVCEPSDDDCIDGVIEMKRRRKKKRERVVVAMRKSVCVLFSVWFLRNWSDNK